MALSDLWDDPGHGRKAMSAEKSSAVAGVTSNGVVAASDVSSPDNVVATTRGGESCTFCLVAEFDIDKGSTLSYQYPEPVNHDEHMLAELMLPDGVHARSEDWTVFFLPASCARFATGHHSNGQSHDTDVHVERGEDQRKDGDRERDRDQGGHKKGKAKDEPLIYVLNLVRTKHDNTVRR